MTMTIPNLRLVLRGCTLAISASTILTITYGCARPQAAPSNDSGKKALIAVSVRKARIGALSRTVDISGSITALNDVMIGPRSAGKVVAVHVREGDRVQQGQIVAIMELTDYQTQVNAALAGLRTAQTRLAQAEAQESQAENLLKQARVNVDVLDTSTLAALEAARASVASADQALQAIKAGARPQERQQAEQQVRAARASRDKLKTDLGRIKDLYKEQAVSSSQLDQAEAAYEAADASYRAAQEALSLMLEGARSEDVKRAELAVEQARQGLRKAEADRSQVDVRRTDVANAQLALKSARDGVVVAFEGSRQAKATLDLARNALNDAQIRAPVSGVVAARLAEPGQQLGSGGQILRIVTPGTVDLEANLPESEYPAVKTGQTVDVTVEAFPDRVFKGRVSQIYPVASSAARSFTVRIVFNDNKDLRPEMYARARIVVGTHTNTTLVPKDAVIFSNQSNQAVVFVVSSDGVAQERKIRVGYMDAESVEILEGIKPGESVIVAGQSGLQTGDRVTISR